MVESLHPILMELLKKRGVRDVRQFLNPSPKDLERSDFLINKEDAAFIADFIRLNKKIAIYGDYDVDGVSACAVFGRFLRDIGFNNFRFIIPNRFKDGYGLNIDRLSSEYEKEGFDLLITFDCGINAVEEVKFLKSKGVSVVITDHHLPMGVLPSADILINPKVVKAADDKDYHLCAAGIAFKLIHMLKKVLNLKSPDLKRYLDMVSLATVADIVPLIGDNRILVKYGLDVINDNCSVGLNTLKKVAKIDEKVNTYHYGFILGPRINASGRLEIADASLQLLMEDDEENAEILASRLELLNRQRKQECDSILEEANLCVDSDKKTIVLFNEVWNKGVVGIVASRLVERYYRPTILFGTGVNYEESVEFISGSGRSIDKIDLFEVLCEIDSKSPGLLEKFGGHVKACGLTIHRTNFNDFAEIFEKTVSSLPSDIFKFTVKYDMELRLKDVTLDLIDQINLMAPFGYGNETPRFLFKDVDVLEYRLVGDGKHLSITLKDGYNNIKGIWFNFPEDLEINNKISFVAFLEKNFYNGNFYPQLKIIGELER